MPALLRTLFALCALAVVTAAAGRAEGIAKGPYLMQPTPTGITVCWVTDNETIGSVRYGKGLIATEMAPVRNHRVKLIGLRPHTRYEYNVVSDGNTSLTGSFVTAAEPKTPSFKFVAYGDTRTQPDKHAAVVAQIVRFRPDFVIQTGDQVADGTNEAQWNVFFETAEPMLRNAAYFPGLGNHEKAGAPYFRFFDVPAEYAFDYGNTHFVCLNSNRPESEWAAQEKFLRDDLAAHQSATWRVVFFHHTLYTCVDNKPDRREDAEKLRARLLPILIKGKVQVVFNGHDHNYQRHVDPANGIQAIVTGGGGAPLYAVKADTPFVKAAKMVYNECEVTVEGTKMTIRAVEPGGAVIETVTVEAKH